MVAEQTTREALVIVSIRLRGHGGRWGMAHQVRIAGVAGLAGYVRSFGTIAEAKRFIKGQVA